jgi:hypothetical protein
MRKCWSNWVHGVAQEWSTALEASIDHELENGGPPKARLPERITALGNTIISHRMSEVTDLGTPGSWELCKAVLELHIVADQASAGLGVPTEASMTKASNFWRRAADMMAKDHTLAQLSRDVVAVCPKMRTPKKGISLRSLSHHLAVNRSEVKVRWARSSYLQKELKEDIHSPLNLLIIPWPLAVEPRDFRPSTHENKIVMDESKHRFFEFSPAADDPDALIKLTKSLLNDAEKRVGRPGARAVHGVVLPELAMSEDERKSMQNLLQKEGVPLLLGGVRGERLNEAIVWTRNPFETSDGDLLVYRQSKHHRWYLDEQPKMLR